MGSVVSEMDWTQVPWPWSSLQSRKSWNAWVSAMKRGANLPSLTHMPKYRQRTDFIYRRDFCQLVVVLSVRRNGRKKSEERLSYYSYLSNKRFSIYRHSRTGSKNGLELWLGVVGYGAFSSLGFKALHIGAARLHTTGSLGLCQPHPIRIVSFLHLFDGSKA